jgi:hypothetical protein
MRWTLVTKLSVSEIHSSNETVEIFIEADFETLPEERRRFAILNIPRHLFSGDRRSVVTSCCKISHDGFRYPG